MCCNWVGCLLFIPRIEQRTDGVGGRKGCLDLRAKSLGARFIFMFQCFKGTHLVWLAGRPVQTNHVTCQSAALAGGPLAVQATHSVAQVGSRQAAQRARPCGLAGRRRSNTALAAALPVPTDLTPVPSEVDVPPSMERCASQTTDVHACPWHAVLCCSCSNVRRGTAARAPLSHVRRSCGCCASTAWPYRSQRSSHRCRSAARCWLTCR